MNHGKALIGASTLAACLVMQTMGMGPASAAGTPTEHESYPIEIDIPDTHCGTFTIRHSTLKGTFERTTFVDPDGSVTHVREHWHLLGLAMDLATGQTLRDDFHENDALLVEGDTWTQIASSGVLYHVHVPGQGLVIGVNGRFIHTASGDVIFKAGPDDDVSDFPQDLCPLFG